MGNYIIYTDSACDIPPAQLQKTGIAYSSLTAYFENEDRSYTIDELNAQGFYEKMRNGHYAKTSAVNIDAFTTGFEAFLKQGTDVLYVGLSSQVSGTYQSACAAAKGLLLKYPDRKIVTVDSCSGSAGQALLLQLLLEKKEAGASLEETARYAEELKADICLWATFDDLTALKKSGRVSLPTAVIGNFLNIKPIIYVDEKGRIFNHSKVRGRKKSMMVLLERYADTAYDRSGRVYLAHSDCLEEVKVLAHELKVRFQAKVERMMDVGPVIGAHAGLGALVLSFLGKRVKE